MSNLLINTNFFLIFIIFIISTILNLILSSFFNISNQLRNIQDIHNDNPSRLGGFVIFIIFFGYEILYLDFFNNLTRFLVLVILAPALAEDLHKFVSPYIRLTIMILGNFFIILDTPFLPQFNFGVYNAIFNNNIFQVFFFTIALTLILNGQNLIDGVHGLSAITAITIFTCILMLSIYVGDLECAHLAFVIIILILSFFIFNYPLGKIFLGDTGSYFLGLLAGYLVIKLFAKNPELPTWLAAIILFYPTFEVVFSYIRRIINKKSPFFPDNKHLHSAIYYFYSKGFSSKKNNNSLVMPTLIGIWASPLLVLIIFFEYPISMIIPLFILILIYLTYYSLFIKLNKK